MLNEDDISYVPKYVQIQNYILQKIKDGVLSEGDRIPSEAELSKQFDVSRITVSTAIKELANARVVERIRGKRDICPVIGGKHRQEVNGICQRD